ncbi:hypothetical protein Nepgr_016887 [Nepenthes gracilis]|uniref:Pentatricopeptide repeat-containing protein n=1 Tax=Nepenthes gracilis TaxID=150966 RepID=A0AAD3XSS5_NEPGR|nr:hypothetical protein Nepgr_016887 [Nepenthes gracilis]
MKQSLSQSASLISRALISASNNSRLTGTSAWTLSLEQTLHRLGCRDWLTPSLVAGVIDPHLLHRPSLSLGFFNWASQQPNFCHSSLTYHSILKSLSVSRHFSALEKLLKEAKSRKIPIDPSIYCSLITSQIKDKKFHEAFLMLNEVNSFVGDIGADLCNSLLAGLASDGYFDFARKLFDDMIVRGVSFSTLGFGLFIYKYCKCLGLSDTLGLLDDIRRRVSDINGSIIAILIINGLCQVGRVSDAFSVLEELRNRDCKPDFMAYRIVVEAFRTKGCTAEVQEVLKRKRKLGVAPRASDYREFIFALISEGCICEASELGEVIVAGNFPIDGDILNALVESVSAVNPSSAMFFWRHFVGKRVPTLLTLSTLSRNLCKHGKTDELLEAFQSLSAKDYFKDLKSYNVMILHLCLAGRVREAYGVLGEMRKNGLAPDISSYNIIMEACCREDLLRPAKKLWDEMFVCGVHGNLKTYNLLIKKFSETGQVEEAQALLNHMFEKRVTPDATTYTSLLEGLCHDSKIDAAIQIFHKAIHLDKTLEQTILSPFVLYLCKGGHFLSASKLLSSLGGNADYTEAHVVLLKCLTDAREVHVAIEHMKQVIGFSPSLSQGIYNELLVLLSSSSSPESILQLLAEMPGNQLTPNNGDLTERLLTWIVKQAY